MSSFPALKKRINNGEIAGFCDPRFERVAQEFERNFQQRDELGASVCVTLEGERMVDLWGGIAHPDSQAPWVEDTLSIVWSATKGATALCAHILASRGLLDLDAPVIRYWPEFGQAGKETTPVKMLLNHQSGLAALSEPLPARSCAGYPANRWAPSFARKWQSRSASTSGSACRKSSKTG